MKYAAIEKAQEILDRAYEAGYFEDCRVEERWVVGALDGDLVNAKASRLLGEEFDDVEVVIGISGPLARPGHNYRPQARASAATWLPEEAT